MFAGINNSKEVIRNRMLRHALNYWNIKNTEDIDPVVKLILEALSSELYNLGNDVKDTEVRLLEKVANLLGHGFLTCPNTAHAILHANPVEPVEELNDTAHFYTPGKVLSKGDQNLDASVDVFFTPVGNTRLFDTHVSYLATGNNLFEFDQTFNKQLIAQTSRGKYIEQNVCWIGLTIDEKVNDLNNLYFYCDWKNMETKLAQVIYQLLPLSKWSVRNKSISIAAGIQYEKDQEEINAEATLFVDYDLLSVMEKDIRQYYNHKFISITDDSINNSNDLKETYP